MKKWFVGVVLVLMASPAFAQSNDEKAADNRDSDVAVGYTFLHDSAVNFPMGITFSEAARVQPHVDIVFNQFYSHGSFTGVDSLGIWSMLGGVRFSGGNGPARGFGEISAGIASMGASILGQELANEKGFAIQPSAGVEVGLTKVIGVRPQVDYLFVHNADGWNNELRFSVAAVFRFAK